MRACANRLIRALSATALLGAVAVLVTASGALGGPLGGASQHEPQCGLAAWTGTCVCVARPGAAPVSFEAFARSVVGSHDVSAVDRARRQCGLGPRTPT